MMHLLPLRISKKIFKDKFVYTINNTAGSSDRDRIYESVSYYFDLDKAIVKSLFKEYIVEIHRDYKKTASIDSKEFVIVIDTKNTTVIDRDMSHRTAKLTDSLYEEYLKKGNNDERY